MRNELRVDEIGKPVANKVLVKVIDTFSEFRSKGGIDVMNALHEDAWADSKEATISEFAIRFGEVINVPDTITRGSFDYETELEIAPGDIVYWNLISFKEHTPLVYNDSKYLLVDYHELLFRIRDGKKTPINGFALITPIAEETTILQYTVKQNVTERWTLKTKPEKINIELDERNLFTDQWEEGDIIHILVRDKPFRVEGAINRVLKEELYAIPLKMILCAE